jgi:hypothetical protein
MEGSDNTRSKAIAWACLGIFVGTGDPPGSAGRTVEASATARQTKRGHFGHFEITPIMALR